MSYAPQQRPALQLMRATGSLQCARCHNSIPPQSLVIYDTEYQHLTCLDPITLFTCAPNSNYNLITGWTYLSGEEQRRVQKDLDTLMAKAHAMIKAHKEQQQILQQQQLAQQQQAQAQQQYQAQYSQYLMQQPMQPQLQQQPQYQQHVQMQQHNNSMTAQGGMGGGGGGGSSSSQSQQKKKLNEKHTSSSSAALDKAKKGGGGGGGGGGSKSGGGGGGSSKGGSVKKAEKKKSGGGEKEKGKQKGKKRVKDSDSDSDSSSDSDDSSSSSSSSDSDSDSDSDGGEGGGGAGGGKRLKRDPNAPKRAQTGYMFFCISAGTLISLADGTSLCIEKVEKGMKVLSRQPADDSRTQEGLTSSTVTRVIDNGVRECVELLLSDGRSLTCTADHRILTTAGRWVEAGKLSVGKEEVAMAPQHPSPVESEDDESHRMASFLPLSSAQLVGRVEVGPRRVFDLSVPSPAGDDGASFVANGVVVHNCRDRRPSIVAAHQTAKPADILALLGAAWKGTTDEEKARYNVQRDADKVRYERQMKEWKEHGKYFDDQGKIVIRQPKEASRKSPSAKKAGGAGGRGGSSDSSDSDSSSDEDSKGKKKGKKASSSKGKSGTSKKGRGGGAGKAKGKGESSDEEEREKERRKKAKGGLGAAQSKDARGSGKKGVGSKGKDRKKGRPSDSDSEEDSDDDGGKGRKGKGVKKSVGNGAVKKEKGKGKKKRKVDSDDDGDSD